MTYLAERNRQRISQAGYDLFAVFSRFEYAMKKGGFRRERSAEAAWHAFANTLPQDFFDRMQNTSEAQIYLDASPKKLEPDEAGGVRWAERGVPPTNALELFDRINTARNNLFHGDKAHDNQRDTDLMLAALFILQAAYDDARTDNRFAQFVFHMDE